MNRGRTFWGILFLLGGGLLLMDNLGLLPASAGRLFWPLLIILVGVWILLRGSRGGTAGEAEVRQEPLADSTRARFRLQHGAGRLQVTGPCGVDELFTGEFVGGIDANVRRVGEAAEVNLSVPSDSWMELPWAGGRGFDWDLRLNGQIPLSMTLETGAGETTLDLTELRVSELKLKTGASSTEVRLPAHAGLTDIKVEAGMAAVTLIVPIGVAARIQSKSGLVDMQVDRARFPVSESGYKSTDYETAENRLDIDVQAGVGSIKIR
ncbi:MAG: LiaF domain-containing protein [Anaerolineales bacterium]